MQMCENLKQFYYEILLAGNKKGKLFYIFWPYPVYYYNFSDQRLLKE